MPGTDAQHSPAAAGQSPATTGRHLKAAGAANPALQAVQEMEKACKNDWRVCLRRLMLDAFILLVAYCALTYAAEKKVPQASSIFKFFAAYILVGLFLKRADTEFSDKLGAYCGLQLGVKAMALLV